MPTLAEPRSRPRGRAGRSDHPLAVAILAVIVAGAVVWPACDAAWSILRGLTGSSGAGGAGVPSAGVPLLGRTFLYALAVGVLATVAAWPAAWASRVLSERWVPIIAVPMLMPSYLAYAGWGLLRAPGTWLGDWLAAGSPTWSLVAGRVLAVLGLALWSWPLGALILGAQVRRIDRSLLDTLRLEPVSPWRRAGLKLALTRGAIASSIGAVGLLMLGSIVPFHLAQIEVYGTVVWRTLDESAWDQRWRAWAAAWPVLIVAAGAGWAIGRRLPATDRGEADLAPGVATPGERVASARPPLVLAGAVWAASVLLPLVIFAASIRESRSLITFWRVGGEGFVASAGIAAGAGSVGALIAAAGAIGFGSSRAVRLATAWLAGLLLVASLVPGVLVGSATAAAWNRFEATRWVGDSGLILVLGHIARFGSVAALVGWWLARTEPPDERALRRLDGGDTLRGWARASLPTQAGGIVGAGLAVACLSFHEIEASVMLQPPGAGNLAQTVLSFLHFARMEEMSAAAVYILGLGLAGALLATWLLSLAAPRRS